MRRSYANAWHYGYDARRMWGTLGILKRPFWRGQNYLTAWDNGHERARTEGMLYSLRSRFRRDRAC